MKTEPLLLSDQQRTELEALRDHDHRPYLRERAAALLKLADGQRVADVAATGLYRRRKRETLYRWRRAYRAHGVAGLVMRPRGHRGFPPQVGERIVQLIRRDPVTMGLARARWRLADVAGQAPAVAGYSRSGLSRALRRLGLRLKRGRLRLHSPDPDYAAKAAAVAAALAAARADPADRVLLSSDEVSCYRHPSLAQRWYPRGSEPCAVLPSGSNRRWRICGGLNAVTGQVVWLEAERCGTQQLCQWLQQVRQTYPTQQLTIVWDNWRPHRHEDVRAEAARLGIDLLFLPIYAPWLNPIEKLWRWLKQDVLHHHALADDWEALKARMTAFLTPFAQPAPDLIRYVGLESE
jgi:transposase